MSRGNSTNVVEFWKETITNALYLIVSSWLAHDAPSGFRSFVPRS